VRAGEPRRSPSYEPRLDYYYVPAQRSRPGRKTGRKVNSLACSSPGLGPLRPAAREATTPYYPTSRGYYP